jgi:peptidyl-prolyl cis-trans isomerase D
MLQAIRSKASSFAAKLLFVVLIVTFVVWGVNFSGLVSLFGGTAANTVVATVGGREISIPQVNQQVQAQLDRMRSVLGTSIDAEQAKQLGILDQALDGMINNNLVELEIKRLGLAIGDEAVRDAILGNPAFRNQAGAFDRNVYSQMLAAEHLTDQDFTALQRTELLRAQLTSALADGMTPPKELVDALYRSRAERRVADLVTLPPSAAGTVPAPTEAQLDEYYNAHKDRFEAPERRSFDVAMLRLDDVAAGIEISEDQLKDAFDKNKGEFATPEQRHVLQLLFNDEAGAKAAAAQLAQGKDFAAVAKDTGGVTTDLGWVGEADLQHEVSEPAFALKEGGTSDPVKDAFGWHILRVTGIKPALEQTFDQVKDKLKQELARDQAANHIADVANTIDDALAGGASFADTVKKFGLKTLSAIAVDAAGKDETGKAADLGADAADVLKAAFSTESGKTSALDEMGDDGYFVVQVGTVAPAAPRPLAEVHDAAARLWQDEARQEALQKVADAIVAEVNAGKSLKDVAAARKLTLTTSAPLPRDGGGDDKLPPPLIAKLFDAKPGAAMDEAAGDSVVIAQLASIAPADPAANKNAVDALAKDLGSSMQNDVLGEYDQALRRTFPVEVDKANLDKVL